LNIAEDRSLMTYSSSGYTSMAESIISGKDGTNIKGSTSPCNAYPRAISNSELGNASKYEGPTQMLTPN